mmetsp:Transcript_8807/g.33235  ORF Transcript_8807/g.33235 Transcript_8807/m.33235 type:complete len:91 (+) Transcript_8807:7505-7777(+)
MLTEPSSSTRMSTCLNTMITAGKSCSLTLAALLVPYVLRNIEGLVDLSYPAHRVLSSMGNISRASFVIQRMHPNGIIARSVNIALGGIGW